MLTLNFTPFPTLTTERLTLRQLELSDGKEIFFLRSDEEANKYIDRPRSKTIDDARNFIEMIETTVRNNEGLLWAITMKGDSKLIGSVLLRGFSHEHNKAEIGYELIADYQGKGLMQEAVAKVIEYGINVLKIKTFEAYINKDNAPSIKLIKKFGFERDSEAEKAIAGKEELKNFVIYTLTIPAL